MKSVVILATENCLFSSVGGPMDVFLQAGILWNGIVGIKPSPYFKVTNRYLRRQTCYGD